MPNCPYCEIELAFCPEGAFCYSCERLYLPAVVRTMDGYNEQEVNEVAILFVMLQSAGLLAKGRNTAEIFEDGIIITPLDE